MKQIFLYLLLISMGFNAFFLFRKVSHRNREREVDKLFLYKTISHKDGFAYFKKQMSDSYPQTKLDHKYYIVYVWDSLRYDFMYRDQMITLDSMATNFGKYQVEYIFATEMDQIPSENFLKRRGDEFKNVKMLYQMDDYISGLYSLNYIKLITPKIISTNQSRKNENEDNLKYKQKILYLIMDDQGKILFTNGDQYKPNSDTAFLNKLKDVLPNNDLKILN